MVGDISMPFIVFPFSCLKEPDKGAANKLFCYFAR